MRTFILAGCLAIALAGAPKAQTPPARGALFIAPMGQPFRADEGQTGVEKWFAQADTDHDGKISLAEFVADADAFLPHADSNGDGTVTSTESTALWRAEAPEVVNDNVSYAPPIDPNALTPNNGHHESHSPNNNSASRGGLVTPSSTTNVRRGQAGPRPIGAQAFGLLGDAEPIMSCDTNFDRRIEKTEFEQCAARRFVELDANHDGFFTPDEVHPWLTDPARAAR